MIPDLHDGIEVNGALYQLGDDYHRLRTSPAPPQISKARYYARVVTLASFARQAARAYPSDPSGATARYLVARKETRPLFRAINAWLGTSYRIPTRS